MDTTPTRVADPEFLDNLRSYLRDVPGPLSHGESVAELLSAFARGRDRAHLVSQVSEEMIAFHGHEALRTIFGQRFESQLLSRNFSVVRRAVSEDGPVVDRGPADLRDRVDRFAVVAYALGAEVDRDEIGGKRPLRAMFLRRALTDAFNSPGYLQEDAHTRALELFRIRQGLMNRRQALLLAAHLNQFGCNDLTGDAEAQEIEWKVAIGPRIGGDAREWLDSVGGEGMCLGGLIGSNDEWRLGRDVMQGLHHLECVRAPRFSPGQVFSYNSARYVLPPRYEVFFRRARVNNEKELRAGQMLVRRKGCMASRALAECTFEAQSAMTPDVEWLVHVVHSRSDAGKCRDELRGSALLIEQVDGGGRYSYAHSKSLEKSVQRYSHALERDEAVQVAEMLRKAAVYDDVTVRLAPRTLRIEPFGKKRLVAPPLVEVDFQAEPVFEPRLFERSNLSGRDYVAVWDLNESEFDEETEAENAFRQWSERRDED